MSNRREVNDRRSNDLEQDQDYPRNRRIRACRRLKNISVELVPESTILRHPVICQMFCNLGYTLQPQ